jgi:hypothetical protein
MLPISSFVRSTRSSQADYALYINKVFFPCAMGFGDVSLAG